MYIKSSILLTICILSTAIYSCQNRKEGAADEQYVSEEKEVEGEYVEDYWNKGEINEFLMYASMVDQMQIRLGEMTIEKAATQEVRNYGNLLKEDHSESLRRLKEILADQDMNVPDTLSKEFNQMIAKLQNASGTSYDRILLDMMILDHKKAIAKYENAKAHIPDDYPAEAWIDNSLPALHRHEQKALQLQNVLKLD